MTVTHDNDISITIRLDPPPPSRRGFGTVLLIAPAADATFGGSGERFRSYNTLEGVQQDQKNGEVTQDQVDAAAFAFSQNNTPDKIIIGNVDLEGGEDHAAALQAIIDKGASFYGVCTQSRTDTEIATLAEAVESHSKPMLCAVQSSLAAIKEPPTDPKLDTTDLSALVGNERTILNYHDRDGAYSDFALLVDRLGFNVDRTSAPWHTDLNDAGAAQAPMQYDTPLEGPERENIQNNHANAIAPFSTSGHYLKPGQTMAGRMAYVQLTADWFKTRLETDIGLEIQDASRSGEKIPVGQAGEQRTPGQVQMAKLVKRRFDQGEEAGHFVPGSSTVRYPEILPQNITEQTIPLEGSTTLVTDGQDVSFTFEFERG